MRRALLFRVALSIASLLAPSSLAAQLEQRADLSGPARPSDVARCLQKRSGVGLGVANKIRTDRRRDRSVPFRYLFSKFYPADPSKPLVNEVRDLEVQLLPEEGGTRALLYLRSGYKLRKRDLPILQKCLGA